MLVWMSRTALELIGQAGLGYSFDPLVSESPDEFAIAVKSFGLVSLRPTIDLKRPSSGLGELMRPCLQTSPGENEPSPPHPPISP